MTQAEGKKNWNAKNAEYRRFWNFKKKYGLSREAYEQLMKDADYRCQICSDDAYLHIDHDHNTGKVRGILCRNCNLAVGYARDSKVILRNAISYLERIF